MDAQKRLLLFFLFLFFLFSVGLVLSLRMEHTYLINIQKLETKERAVGFEKILKLEQQAIFVLANDYSFWDELVMAIKKSDQEWAKINIDSGIKTYDADGAWVYNKDFKLIYSVNKFDDGRLKTLPLNNAMVEKIFSKGALAHFFIATPAGYLELQGATVHPSNDSERKTPSEGYIFAGKLWNADYLNALSELTNCTISLSEFSPHCLSVSKTEKSRVPLQDHFFITVDDWRNIPAFTIIGTVDSEGIDRFQNHSRIFIKMFSLYTVIQMLFLFYLLRRFLREPRKIG